MSYNTFGRAFRFTTYGESHGPAIGCIIDGTPAGLDIDEAYIQSFLDRRRPGQSRFTTQRQEKDQVAIQSGVFEGKTTGTPIHLQILNQDTRSKDYSDIADKYRPGHADYTYEAKYGLRDWRGGGRSSARETACRVAAGAVARRILGDKIRIAGAMVQVGPHEIPIAQRDYDFAKNSRLFCPDPSTEQNWMDYLDGVRKDGNSVGAVIEIIAFGVPAGWGAPVYGKLDADLASAMMSINAVKGVEIGAGMEAASLLGSENADEMIPGPDGKPQFLSNNAGGVLGGISSGAPVVCRFAVKPTSSILTERRTIDKSGKSTVIKTKGRHDPCVGIRAVPVGEAMMAIVLTDHMMQHRAQMG